MEFNLATTTVEKTMTEGNEKVNTIRWRVRKELLLVIYQNEKFYIVLRVILEMENEMLEK